jgi:hypothetical protein
MKNLIFGISILLVTFSIYAQDKQPLVGKWDMEITHGENKYPSWLEVKLSGVSTYVGQFVASGGSARPISEIIINGDKFSFVIPPQWNPKRGNLAFSGVVRDDKISGTITYEDGMHIAFKGVRAPVWEYKEVNSWNKPKKLFNGKDLSGWKMVGKKPWIVENGILKGPGGAANIVTKEEFTNFKLYAEFRYPENSNSGIYLRGRYEVQIEDGYGKAPSNIHFGGIYGFLTPNRMAAKQAGEWQTYEITLIGNRVTVIANGKPIIVDQTIPGITGGAINSKEAMPGPIMIQGDHGAVEFRKIEIATAKD